MLTHSRPQIPTSRQSNSKGAICILFAGMENYFLSDNFEKSLNRLILFR